MIGNAIRYTDVGEVSVEVENRGAKAIVTVRDTGRGIPEGSHEDVFMEYVQLDNPERDRSRGFGLGLSIVKRLSTLLNIDVELDSKVGQGTVFRLSLPSVEKALVPEESIKSFTEDHTTKHVLVIDDEADILEGMAALLKRWDYKYTTAESANEAILKLNQQGITPDIILSDFRLREHQTGAEAITRLRDEFNLQIPGVIITGDTAPERLSEANSSGYELMHKPVQPMELKQLLIKSLL